ncbi:MAG: S41 family peptidase [Bacteroidales bacterium]|jgi:hypothetical protein|nr:S41 family peptidase [Bacteroidales bacterium]
MKKMLIICYFCGAGLWQTACHKIFVDDNPANTPLNNFDLVWSQVDEHYPYFQEKGVNWNTVRSKYRPKVNHQMTGEELFGILAQMLGELRDGHVNLVSPFNISRYWDWYQDYPRNVNWNIVDSAYLRKDFIYTGGVMAQKVGNTAYLWFESFSVTLNKTGMKYIIDKFRDCKGFIIDLRANGGGLVNTMYELGSYLVKEKTHVGYLRYKTGKGHNDFSDYYMEYFKPNDEGIRFNKPVVILTGRQSYSAANIFPGFAKGLPQITLMGETTGGGSASPLSIHLLNGWILRMSNFCMTDREHHTFEFGVEPDIHVDFSPVLERRGKDALIEAAVMYLNR